MPRIHFLGHAGFEIGIEGLDVLIDPFFGTGVPECTIPTIPPSTIRGCDIIFLTHEHLDHCDPRIINELAARTGAAVVAPSETLAELAIDPKQKVDVRVGNKFSLKGLSIQVVEAAHPQSRYPTGYIIGDAFKIYHAGDTYVFSAMSGIVCDVAMLPIGGLYTMDTIAAITATKMMRARYVIPMHYGTFPRIRADVGELQRGARGKVIVMKPDESIEL